MFYSTLFTNRPIHIRSTTITSITFRVRHHIMLTLKGALEKPWLGNLCRNFSRPCPSDLALEKFPLSVLALFISLFFSLRSDSLFCYTIDVRYPYHQEHLCTTFFFYQVGHAYKKPTLLVPRISHHSWSILGKFSEV